MRSANNPASPEWRIRPFQPADTDAILGILREAEEAAQWPSESYANLAATPGGVLLICEANGQAIAFLAGRQVADEAEILNIAVSRDFRSLGIGSALLLAALHRFQHSAAASVFLEFRASNRAARTLYEHHGFVPSGSRKSYYGDPPEDAVCMRKKLTGTSD